MSDKIDIESLNKLFPYGLPNAPNNFLASEAVQVLEVDYQKIRQHTKYLTTNRGAWLRLRKQLLDYVPPVTGDNNIEYAYVNLSGSSTEGGQLDRDPENIALVSKFSPFLAMASAYPKHPYGSMGEDLHIWQFDVLINGEKPEPGVVNLDLDYSIPAINTIKNENIYQQLLNGNMWIEINPYMLTPGKEYTISTIVNGTPSDPSGGMGGPAIFRVLNDRPVMFPTITEVYSSNPNRGRGEDAYFNEFRVAVELPMGANSSYFWELRMEGPGWEESTYVKEDFHTENPSNGSDLIHFRVFPHQGYKGPGKITAFGTSEAGLVLESNTYDVPQLKIPHPADKMSLNFMPIGDGGSMISRVNLIRGTRDNPDKIYLAPHTWKRPWNEVTDGEHNHSDVQPVSFFIERDPKSGNQANNYLSTDRPEDDFRGPRFEFQSSDTNLVSIMPTFMQHVMPARLDDETGLLIPRKVTENRFEFVVPMHPKDVPDTGAPVKLFIREIGSEIEDDKKMAPMEVDMEVKSFFGKMTLATSRNWLNRPVYGLSNSRTETFTFYRKPTDKRWDLTLYHEIIWDKDHDKAKSNWVHTIDLVELDRAGRKNDINFSITRGGSWYPSGVTTELSINNIQAVPAGSYKIPYSYSMRYENSRKNESYMTLIIEDERQ